MTDKGCVKTGEPLQWLAHPHPRWRGMLLTSDPLMSPFRSGFWPGSCLQGASEADDSQSCHTLVSSCPDRSLSILLNHIMTGEKGFIFLLGLDAQAPNEEISSSPLKKSVAYRDSHRWGKFWSVTDPVFHLAGTEPLNCFWGQPHRPRP